MTEYQNALHILGVNENFTPSQLRASYKKLANRYHPDKPHGDRDKFDDVRLSYELLKKSIDVTSRPPKDVVKYEVTISLRASIIGTEVAIDGKPICIPPSKNGVKYIISDILGYDSILVVNVSPDQKFKVDGNDLFTTEEITVFDAMLGTNIKIEHPSGEDIYFFIDSPIKDGKVVKVSGKGLPKANNLPCGDLYVVVNVLIPDLTDEQKKVIIGARDKL